MIIRLNRPAERWAEATPLGNGFFGAMVYGRTYLEQIDLSALTCFSGQASHEQDVPENGAAAFASLRAATLSGDYKAAREQTKAFMGRRNDYGTNLPAAALHLGWRSSGSHTGQTEEPQLSDYQRQLQLDKASCDIQFTGSCQQTDDQAAAGKTVVYQQQAILSHADLILAINRQASQPGQLSGDLYFSGEHLSVITCGAGPLPTFSESGKPSLSASADADNHHKQEENTNIYHLAVRGQALENMHSSGQTGVSYVIAFELIVQGGRVKVLPDRLRVDQADTWLLKLTLETDFIDPDPARTVIARLRACRTKGWEQLRQRHEADFLPLMQNAALRLGPAQTLEKPLDLSAADLADSQDESQRQALIALMFQFGRYLLAASSRSDSPLPAPLQGIWNDQVASRIGWTCDMHLDINTQMNYWPAEITGLRESVKPLLKWIKEKLVPSGRITARQCYGLPGWAAELVSNAWGYTAPYWSPSLSPCPTGGAWLLHQIWQHYLYEPDINLLYNDIFPLLSEAVDFFSAYLFKTDAADWYHSGPSISPENSFLVDGSKYQASISCTYEIAVIRDLFTAYLEACQALRCNQKLSSAEEIKSAKVNQQLSQLPPPLIDSDGRLKEWRHNFSEADPQHRHTSHLLMLYPYRQITPEQTPALAKAAQKTIDARLTPYENWEDTGWARAMLMLYAARLQDGNQAYAHITDMLRHLTQFNLMVKHPPTRGAPAFSDVYELDGNTGLTTCIAEMLLQGYNNTLHLLPALPDAWQEGAISGFRAPGGISISFVWAKNKPIQVTLHSQYEKTVHLRFNENMVVCNLKSDQPYRLSNKEIDSLTGLSKN